MQVKSLGGVGEVTGSCHMVISSGKHFLLDCGMHQGGDPVVRMRRDKFGFQPGKIDAVILSHAHLDHSGLLPKLVSRGFHGPIYCTPATRNLLAIMLEDAANIYFRDIEHANLRKRRSGRRTQTAEYDMADVLAVLEQCVVVPYNQHVELAPGLDVRFLDAGHILGSAVTEITEKGPHETRTLVYSGDLGNTDSVLMRDPEVPETADLVLMESTYGNRDHRALRDTVAELHDVLDSAWQKRGMVLMPAFAVGRTQELLFHLGCLYHAGALKNWQVFLDSPMAIAVTRLYSDWLDALDPQDHRLMAHQNARTLEEFLPCLRFSESVEDSVALNRLNAGAIIIAGSGMCNGGRIRHHLKHRVWLDSTHLVFTGFQAQGTLGRKIVDGADRIRMFGHQFAVRARVHTLGGFSAHAGQSELLAWAGGIGGNPRFHLVHGEPSASEALCEKMKASGFQVAVAVEGEVVEV